MTSPSANTIPYSSALSGTALRAVLTDLLELTLLAKHAHRNVTGPRFRSVHLELEKHAWILSASR